MPFDNPTFQTLVRSRWLGRSYTYLPTVDSTNSYLKQHAPTLPSGAVVVTDFQQAGRGRHGRTWLAPAERGLLVSVLFRPAFDIARATWLTMIAGLAAVDAITAQTGLHVALKWPNDVMLPIDNVWHKVGGILLESELGDDGGWRSAIVGMGLNVNLAADDLPQVDPPAGSLLVARGQSVAREPLLAAWLHALESWYDRIDAGQSPQPAWNARLLMLGQPVTVSGTPPRHGIAEGTDDRGSLLVRDAGGTLHVVVAGDVSLRAAPDQA